MITEILKYGGEAIADWLYLSYSLLRRKEKYLTDTNAAIVPLFKGKEKQTKNECYIYRVIRLLSLLGQVFGKIVIKTVEKMTKDKICKEQGGFSLLLYVIELGYSKASFEL